MEFIKPKMAARHPVIEGIRKDLNLPNFIEPSNDNDSIPPFATPVTKPEIDLPHFAKPVNGRWGSRWGFGGILAKTGEEPDWVSYRCPLPILKRQEDEAKEAALDHPFAASATLKIFFEKMYDSDEETGSELPQLLAIEGMRVERGDYGSLFWVFVGKVLVPWLANHSDNSAISEMISAMASANRFMFPSDNPINLSSFQAKFTKPKSIALECPGNVCSLAPKGACNESDNGYKLIPHNIDDPLQQLTLLVGVAKMYELARKEGY
jgi:hypothetical protein